MLGAIGSSKKSAHFLIPQGKFLIISFLNKSALKDIYVAGAE